MKKRPDPSTKPYYRCLSCSRFGKTCGGHSTRDMTLQEWCEYMRDVKEQKRLTSNQIAESADVSIKTIERLMAITIDQDIRRDTARRIEMAIIGSSNQYPCYLDYDDSTLIEKIAQLEEKLKFWREENEIKKQMLKKLM